MEKKKNLTNDENIKNLKKRKVILYVIMACSILTMIFAFLDLLYRNVVFLILAIVFLIAVSLLNRYRDSLEIIKKDELEEVRKEIKKNKEKFRRNAVNIEEDKEEEKTKKKSNKKKTSKKKKTNKKESN